MDCCHSSSLGSLFSFRLLFLPLPPAPSFSSEMCVLASSLYSLQIPFSPFRVVLIPITFAYLLSLLFSEKRKKPCNLLHEIVLQLDVFLNFNSLNVTWDVNFLCVLFHDSLFQETTTRHPENELRYGAL